VAIYCRGGRAQPVLLTAQEPVARVFLTQEMRERVPRRQRLEGGLQSVWVDKTAQRGGVQGSAGDRAHPGRNASLGRLGRLERRHLDAHQGTAAGGAIGGGRRLGHRKCAEILAGQKQLWTAVGQC